MRILLTFTLTITTLSGCASERELDIATARGAFNHISPAPSVCVQPKDGRLALELTRAIRTELRTNRIPLQDLCAAPESFVIVRVSASDTDVTTEGTMVGRVWSEISVERQEGGVTTDSLTIIDLRGAPTLSNAAIVLSKVLLPLLTGKPLPHNVRLLERVHEE